MCEYTTEQGTQTSRTRKKETLLRGGEPSRETEGGERRRQRLKWSSSSGTHPHTRGLGLSDSKIGE